MTTREITLDQNSDDGLYTQILRGRYVTRIDGSTITLDNGTELHIQGNEGCGGCGNGWYWLEQVYKQGSRRARIMSAYVAYDEEDKDEESPSVYTIFVMVDGNPTQLPLATVRGSDGNGYYGTGFTLTATIKTTPPPSTASASRPPTSSSPKSAAFTETTLAPKAATFPTTTSSTTPKPTAHASSNTEKADAEMLQSPQIPRAFGPLTHRKAPNYDQEELQQAPRHATPASSAPSPLSPVLPAASWHRSRSRI